VLRNERGDSSTDEVGRSHLVQQNVELSRKLEEEHSNYKRKLQSYQDGQIKQAQLVQKLQAKVRGTVVKYVQWSNYNNVYDEVTMDSMVMFTMK